MKIFDFTNRTESIARRRSSNTPLQALLLMNDPQYVEAYRSLAADALKSSRRRERATRLVCIASARARRRAPRTSRCCATTTREQRAAYAGNDAKTASVLDVGVVPADPALDRTALAALTNVAALVMNSPDAYTVR